MKNKNKDIYKQYQHVIIKSLQNIIKSCKTALVIFMINYLAWDITAIIIILIIP
jgi:hypothetical protein